LTAWKSDPKTAGLMPDQSKAHARMSSSRIAEEKLGMLRGSAKIPPFTYGKRAISSSRVD